MNDDKEQRSASGRKPTAPPTPGPEAHEDRVGHIRRLAAEIAAADRELLDRLA